VFVLPQRAEWVTEVCRSLIHPSNVSAKAASEKLLSGVRPPQYLYPGRGETRSGAMALLEARRGAFVTTLDLNGTFGYVTCPPELLAGVGTS